MQLKRDRVARLQHAYGERFSFIECDFADYTALVAALVPHDFGGIVHLGAQAGVRYSIDNPHAYVQSNLVGHVNILEIARARRVGYLVYASSSSVYGGNTNMPFRVEDRVDRPLSLYAATKKADGLMSETYAHLYRLPQTGLRFFTVYGPWGGPDMAMWIFTKAILAGESIPVFNHGKMQRDFTYIDDIVSGVVGSLDNPPADDGSEKAGGSTSPHRIYNIGNNRPEMLEKMIDIIERECGRPAVRNYLPLQPGDVIATAADISAITADIGFEPTTAIEIGIPRFVRWYRDYHGV